MMLVVTVALVVIVIIMESRDTDGDDDGVCGNVGGMISWLVYVLPIFYLCSHFPNASLLTAYLPDVFLIDISSDNDVHYTHSSG